MTTDRGKLEETQAAIEERAVEAELRMEKSLEALHRELGAIRTGRASPSLIERLQVDYYGAMTPLQSLASISSPEARLLVIQPYDRGAISAIEKALQKSELHLNPNNDGQVIRINIPALTEDRRRDFVKMAHRKAEEARVSVRNIRRDEVEFLRKLERDGQVSKDDFETRLTTVQRLTDSFITKVEETVRRKEDEIVTV